MNVVFRAVSNLNKDTLELYQSVHKVQVVKETSMNYLVWYGKSHGAVKVEKDKCFFTEEAARNYLFDLHLQHQKKLRAAMKTALEVQLKVFDGE